MEGNLVDSKNDHVWGLPLCLLWYFTPASAGVYPPSKVLVIGEGYVLAYICVHSGYRTIGEHGELHWRQSACIRGHVVHSSVRFLSREVLWLLWNIDIGCRSCVTVVISLLSSQSFSCVSDCILCVATFRFYYHKVFLCESVCILCLFTFIVTKFFSCVSDCILCLFTFIITKFFHVFLTVSCVYSLLLSQSFSCDSDCILCLATFHF